MLVSGRVCPGWTSHTLKVSSADTTGCLAACDETMSATITVVGDSSLVTRNGLLGWRLRLIWLLSPEKLRGKWCICCCLMLFVGETICKGMCHSVVIKNQSGIVSIMLLFFNLYFGKWSKLTYTEFFKLCACQLHIYIYSPRTQTTRILQDWTTPPPPKKKRGHLGSRYKWFPWGYSLTSSQAILQAAISYSGPVVFSLWEYSFNDSLYASIAK